MAVRLTYLGRVIGRPAFAIALAVAAITAVTGGTGARAMAGTTAGSGARAGAGTTAGTGARAMAGVTGGSGGRAGAATSCQHATGPFHVSGTQVLGAGGKVFVPYGITVPGLANQNWSASVAGDENKINATASSWCANTVRLQVAQDNLIGVDGSSYNAQFMAAIEEEVSLAESDGLVVVINDQTETATVDYQLGPTPGTETFWKDIIGVYGSDHQVIFDLFNEPRTYSSGMSQAQEWGLWHDGGSFDGNNYIGMAALASYVRAADASTLFWVEGPDYSASFAGMESQDALLSTSGVVYAVHHPAGAHDSSAWYDDFGYLINTGVAPVVDGEWTNYQPSPNANSECWSDAPTQVPVFLSYLTSHGIGMTAYQLAEGLLVTSNSDLADPTTINAATWSCTPTSTPTNQGAGALIMNWYQEQNGG
jgi:Cellulase (glycosyl hydrolase family 5)